MGKEENKRPHYVMLEEEMEDSYQPTQEELNNYGEYLGMVLPRDKDLLWIAHEGLTKPLAKEWKPCRTEDDEIYYFNFETGESQWDHPCDETHRNLLRDELQRLGKPLAKQSVYCKTDSSSSSKSKIRENIDKDQDEDRLEEEVESEVTALISKSHEVHRSKEGITSKNSVLDHRLSPSSSVDTRSNEQMDDADISQRARVSEKLSKQEEVMTTSTTWKSTKETDEVVGFTYGSKEEEEREMVLQKERMMKNVKKKIEEEESVVLQQARRAMQERVDMVVKEEQDQLFADERLRMSDVMAKQMELEKETELTRWRTKLKIELEAEMEDERNQRVDEERTKMYDEVVKQIQKERAAEVMQMRKNVESEQNIHREAGKEDLKADETRHLRKSTKTQEEYSNDRGNEGLLLHKLELDEKQKERDEELRVLFLDSTNGTRQVSRDHKLHCELCSLTILERREFASIVKEKIKLEELQLYDELKEKMVIRVTEVISALERHMFEEEHQLAKTKLRDNINKLYKGLMQEAEIQLLQEKEILLRGKREDMHRRLGSFGALDIPVATSFDDTTTSKEWRGDDDKNNDVEIEYLWSTEHSRRQQMDKLGNVEDILSKKYLRCSLDDAKRSSSSNTSILPSTGWKPQPEEKKIMRVENMRIPNMSTTSRITTDRLENIDASVDITSDLKIWRSQIEETMKDLTKQFRNDLRNELLSLKENKEIVYLPSIDQQESSRVVDLPQNLSSSIEGWRTEVEKEIRDLVQHCREELESRFCTLKEEVKEELSVLSSHKDVIPENLRRIEQETHSKLVTDASDRFQHLTASNGKTNNVDATNRSEFSHLDRFSVHVMLETDKRKLSKINEWISEAEAPTESGFILEHPHAEQCQAYEKAKTIENLKRFLLAECEEKLLPNSLRFANEYDWTRMHKSNGLHQLLTHGEISTLQKERLNRWLQKYMKWIIQHVSSSWRRADTISLKCGLVLKQAVRRLDSSWAVVVSLIEKSRRECKMARYKGAKLFHASFDSELSSQQGRRLDRSLRIDPKKRHKDVDGWMVSPKLDNVGSIAARGSSPSHNLGHDKRSVSDFHLALCPQENDGKMRWLYSDSELEELRDMWKMDAGYAKPTTKQTHEVSNQQKAQVQATRKWYRRASDSSTSQLREDTNSNVTSNYTNTVSHHGTSSTSMERHIQLDMLELQDAIATFRQSRESSSTEDSGLEQVEKTSFDQQRSEIPKTRVFQDKKETKGILDPKTELLQLRSQPWNLMLNSEIIEIEEQGPDFITLEFARAREDEFAIHGMQANRAQCNSNSQHSQSSLHHGDTTGLWRI